jgi:hypothetical protein
MSNKHFEKKNSDEIFLHKSSDKEIYHEKYRNTKKKLFHSNNNIHQKKYYFDKNGVAIYKKKYYCPQEKEDDMYNNKAYYINIFIPISILSETERLIIYKSYCFY